MPQLPALQVNPDAAPVTQTLTTAAAPLTVTATSLPSADVTTLDVPSNPLTAELSALLSELSSRLSALQQFLSSRVFQETLPLIGNALGLGSSALTTALGEFQGFETALVDAIQTLVSNPNVTIDAINSALAALTTTSPLAPHVQAHIDSATQDLILDVTASGTAAGLDVPLDPSFGLPGLKLATIGNVSVSIGYTFNDSFTVTGGGTGVTDSTQTPLSVNIVANAPSFTADVDLGFLRFGVTDNHSELDGTFTLNTDGDISLSGGATVDLGLSSDLGSARFPSISAELYANWPLGTVSLGDTSETDLGSQPTVEIKNYSIDLGSFLNNFLQPIFSEITSILSPIQGLIDALNADLTPFFDTLTDNNTPISDLQAKAGGANGLYHQSLPNGGNIVTLMDLLAFGGGVNQSLLTALTIINEIESLSGALHGATAGTINLGTIPLLGDIRSPGFDSTDAAASVANATQTVEKALGGITGLSPSQLDQLTGALSNYLPDSQDSNADSITIASPLLDDPQKAVDLLLGNSGVDLFTLSLQPPALDIGDPFTDPPQDETFLDFPLLVIPGLADATMAFSIGARLNLAFGYDASGLIQFANDPSHNVNDLFNGFYVEPVVSPADGTPLPVLSVQGEIYAGLSALEIFGFGGYIDAAASVGLANPGKTYLDTVNSILSTNNGKALWTLFGDVAAGARVTAPGYSPTVYQHTFIDFSTSASGSSEPKSPGVIYFNNGRSQDNNEVLHPDSYWEDGDRPDQWTPQINISNDGSVEYFGQANITGNTIETITYINFPTGTTAFANLPIYLSADVVRDFDSLHLAGQTDLIQNGGSIIIDGSGGDSGLYAPLSVTNLGLIGGLANTSTITLEGYLGAGGADLYGNGTLAGSGTIGTFIVPAAIGDLPELASEESTPGSYLRNQGNKIIGEFDIEALLNNDAGGAIIALPGAPTILRKPHNNGGLIEALGQGGFGGVVSYATIIAYGSDFIGGTGTLAASDGRFFLEDGSVIDGETLTGGDFIIQGNVLFDGGVDSSWPVTIEGTVNIGGYGDAPLVAQSTLTLEGLIETKPWFRDNGAALIEATGPQTELLLQSATLTGGHYVGKPATGIGAGTIVVAGDTKIETDVVLNGIYATGTPGVLFGGPVQIGHNAVLQVSGVVAPDDTWYFGSPLATQFYLNNGTIIAAGFGEFAQNADTAFRQAVVGTIDLVPGGNNIISGNTSGALFKNEWLIEGAGAVGNGIAWVVNDFAYTDSYGIAHPAGTIDANAAQPLVLNGGVAGVTNLGLLEATDDGVLTIASNVTNTAGTIDAVYGVVAIGGETIYGGTLAAGQYGLFQLGGATRLDGSTSPVTLAAGANLGQSSNGALALVGTIVNQATILAATNSAQYASVLASAELTGGGSVLLSGPEPNSNFGYAELAPLGGSSTLDNVDNLISGNGMLASGLVITNETAGRIQAGGGNILIDNAFVNNAGVIDSAGGTLLVNGNVLNPNGTVAASGGILVLSQGTINTGTLVTANGGRIIGTAGAIQDVTIAAGAQVGAWADQPYGYPLLTMYGRITNHGTLVASGDAAGGVWGELYAGGSIVLAGGGTVLLTDRTGVTTGAKTYLGGVSGVGAIDNLDNTITGYGQIYSVPLTNETQGVIEAAGGTLTLSAQQVTTNAGLIEAVGGTLDIRGTIDNRLGGTIAVGSDALGTRGVVLLEGRIDGGSVVSYQGASSSGVQINSGRVASGAVVNGVSVAQGPALLVGAGGTLDGTSAPVTIAAGVDLLVGAGDTLIATGSVVNSGTISITGSTSAGTLLVLGSVVLTGGGQVTLSDASAVASFAHQVVESIGSSATLVNADNLISGYAQFGGSALSVINQSAGTIVAMTSTLALASSVTNSGLLDATTGELDITARISNTAGTVAADGGLTVLQRSGTVAGGVLRTTGAGLIAGAGGTIDGSANAVTIVAGSTVGAQAGVDGGAGLLTLGGTIVNHGTLRARGNRSIATSGGQIDITPNTTLQGGGVVVLDDQSGAGTSTAPVIDGAAAGSALDNIDNLITGYGQLGSGIAIRNEIGGTIQAAHGTLSVNTRATPVLNAGLIEAVGGTLDLYLGTIDSRSGGTILALDDAANNPGMVWLDAWFEGGVFGTDPADRNAILQGAQAGGTLDGTSSPVSITAGAHVRIGASDLLYLTGAIHNAGTIAVIGNGQAAVLGLLGAATLSAGGTISLSDASGSNAYTTQIVDAHGSGVTLDNVDNLITGAGKLGSAGLFITNETAGRIIAAGGTLLLNSNVRNTGLLDATTGELDVNAVIANVGGTVAADGGLTTLLSSAVVQGGLIRTTGSGVVVGLTGTLDGSASPVTIAAGSSAGAVSGTDNTASELFLNGTILNHGTLIASADQAAARNPSVELAVLQSLTLGGGGQVRMWDQTGTGTTAGSRLLGALTGSVLENVDNLISGYGQIGEELALRNDRAGTIQASGGLLSVLAQAVPAVNSGTMQALGGTLDLSGRFDNTSGGTIQALSDALGHSGTVLLDGTLIGGTIATDAQSVLRSASASGTLDGTHGAVTALPGARIVAGAATNLILEGTLNNQGTVTLIGDESQSYYSSLVSLVAVGSVTLKGGGKVVLTEAQGRNAQGIDFIVGASNAAVLDNVDNAVSGSGFFNLNSVTNEAQGLIASQGGVLRVVVTTLTNTGLIDAADGTLDLYANVINAGGTISASGGLLLLDGGTIHGGTLTTSGAGVLREAVAVSTELDGSGSAIVIAAGATVTDESWGLPVNDDTVLDVTGTIANHGTISIDSTPGASSLIGLVGAATLTGGGTVVLKDPAGFGISPHYAGFGAVGGTGTLDNVDNLITGAGGIGITNTKMVLVNRHDGTIAATGTGALTISYAAVNTGLLAAEGGVLDIHAAVANSGGTVGAFGSNVLFDDTGTISGGALLASGGGAFIGGNSGGTLDGTGSPVTIGAGVTVGAVDGVFNRSSGIWLTGSIVNQGTLLASGDDANSGGADIWTVGSATLSGGGTVRLLDQTGDPSSFSAQFQGYGSGATLDNVDNLISGWGLLGYHQTTRNEAAGTIEAAGGRLTLNYSSDVTTNAGLIEAFGGTLVVQGTLDGTAGGTLAALGDGLGHSGTVTVSAVLRGGTIETDAMSSVQINGGTTLDGAAAPVALASGAQVTLAFGQSMTLDGTIVNAGTVTVYGGIYGGTGVLVSGSVALEGGGRLMLADGNGVPLVSGLKPGAVLDNSGDTIAGYGLLGDGGLSIINDHSGTISSSGGVLMVNTGTSTLLNRGVIEAQSGTLVVENTITNTGTIRTDGGKIILQGPVAGNPAVVTAHALFAAAPAAGVTTSTIVAAVNPVLEVDAGGTLVLEGSVDNSETVAFDGAGTLVLDALGGFSGVISGFGTGDVLDLASIHHSASDQAVVEPGNTLQVMTSGGTFDLRFDPAVDLDGVTFHLGGDGGSGSALTGDYPLCFLPGSLIRTPHGEVPVETLRPGDDVVTWQGAVRPVTWIGRGRVLATRGRRSAATPVVISKGALGDNMPYRDLRVTMAHGFLFDGVLIPAQYLVNHRSIRWDDHAQEVELYHVELETHDVLIANGAPAESYRDDGNRWLFQNANERWSEEARPAGWPVVTGGPIVDAVWSRLLARAGGRPGLPLTTDPDVHLLVDGRRIDPAGRGEGSVTFRLQNGFATLRLASRSAAPSELGLTRDPRQLGVALRRMVVWAGQHVRVCEADDGRLGHGFHDYEPDEGLRWTNGDALLPSVLFDGLTRALSLTLYFSGSTSYPDEGAAVQAAA